MNGIQPAVGGRARCWSVITGRCRGTAVTGGVHGAIRVEKRTGPEEPGDRSVDALTFIAQGD